MAKWRKLKPTPKEKVYIGCLNCSTVQWPKASMKTRIWGENAFITKDGKMIYCSDENIIDIRKAPTLQKIEKMAQKDPDHDWRFVKITGLHDETYQRQGQNNWVMVKSGPGYA